MMAIVRSDRRQIRRPKDVGIDSVRNDWGEKSRVNIMFALRKSFAAIATNLGRPEGPKDTEQPGLPKEDKVSEPRVVLGAHIA
jgi:hypothetical protein